MGDGVLKQPTAWRHLWNPWRPSWGEPYIEQVERMSAAIEAARVAAQGKDALVVSHQLPIWILRSSVEGRRFLHDPRKRQCSLASVTSLHFDASGNVVGLSYSSFTSSYEPFKCFNETSTTTNSQGTWRSGNYPSGGLFNSTTYSTSNLVSGYNGDWLVIKLPLSIKLKKSLDTLPKKEYPLQPRLVHSSDPHLPA